MAGCVPFRKAAGLDLPIDFKEIVQVILGLQVQRSLCLLLSARSIG